MKRALSLILVLVLCVGLCACKSTQGDNQPPATESAVMHPDLSGLKDISSGGVVEFGSYYCYADNDAVQRPVSWIVLDITDGYALLLSEKILDCIKYDSDTGFWPDSYIRSWLNKDFYNVAFTDAEKALITNLETSFSHPNTGELIAVNDYVQLLSMQDVQSFMSEETDKNRTPWPSDYAVSAGLELYNSFVRSNTCNWWLIDGDASRAVFMGGQLGNCGQLQSLTPYSKLGVRPIIVVNINKLSEVLQ